MPAATPPRPIALALVLACCAAPPLSAAEDDDAAFSCPANADGVAPEVRRLLAAEFAATADDGTKLAENFRNLEILVLQAGHCSASARSTRQDAAGRDQNIMEWHSMNQWLSRIVNIMSLNVRGDRSRDWRDEYALFAEVYEFEP